MPRFILTTKDVNVKDFMCALTRNDTTKIVAPIDTVLNEFDVEKVPSKATNEHDKVWCEGWNACLEFLFQRGVSLDELDFCSEVKTPCKRVVVDKELDEFANGFDIGWNSCIEHTVRLNHSKACQNNGNKR